ncbi:MAG: MFS transporter [Thermoprotei archaeon]|nr:MAG: MFS transporter [Thermoprotei archaeon]
MDIAQLFKRREFIAFIALSLVSLFADMTYEGARSVLGAYLRVLEATALVAGVVSVGDLLGYLMRGVGGFLAGFKKSSRVYWALVFGGYAINLFAVPLLAFAGRWEVALGLVLLERVGKGLRTPARDVILSEVTESIGRGKGFGLHELMDQVGAVSGPLIVMWALYSSGGSYHLAFIVLFVPATIALLLLAIAYSSYPTVRAVREAERSTQGAGLPRSFWLFTIGTALLSAGYAHWALAAYSMEATGAARGPVIALLYTIAMLVDAAVALPAGVLYDRFGPATITVTPVLAAATTPMILSGDTGMVMAAAALWGVVMGIYETNMRVVVADLTTPATRAYAYGVYGVVFGVSWTLGNVVLARLLEVAPGAIAPYVVGAELAALAVFVAMLRSWRR